MSKVLKNYRVSLETEYAKNSVVVTAETPSKARYAGFREEWSQFWEYTDVYSDIRCKCLGPVSASHYYNSNGFERMTKARGIQFASIGMRVEVAGRKGVIVGSNSSLNLNVWIEDYAAVDNCHPYWETVYFDDDGGIVKDYREVKSLKPVTS